MQNTNILDTVVVIQRMHLQRSRATVVGACNRCGMNGLEISFLDAEFV